MNGLIFKGSLLTPEPTPALRRTDNLGAIALPVLLFEIIITDAFSFLEISEITLAYV